MAADNIVLHQKQGVPKGVRRCQFCAGVLKILRNIHDDMGSSSTMRIERPVSEPFMRPPFFHRSHPQNRARDAAIAADLSDKLMSMEDVIRGYERARQQAEVA
jgi:hypothetical protein